MRIRESGKIVIGMGEKKALERLRGVLQEERLL